MDEKSPLLSSQGGETTNPPPYEEPAALGEF